MVNNAQRAHVGLLGSVEAIAHAKGEVYGGLVESGIAVVNEDDAYASYWKKLNTAQLDALRWANSIAEQN